MTRLDAIALLFTATVIYTLLIIIFRNLGGEQMTDYEIYLEKYATKHEITKEEAESHYIVREVKKYYEELQNV